MVITPDSRPLAAPTDSPAPQFNWRQTWYPIAFEVDLPRDRPYGFAIFGEPLVLFQAEAGAWVCLRDRCPHRLAKLSDGQVINGRVECLYHGWQFGQGGQCHQIPQLLAGAEIPQRATVAAFPVQVQQGILWVWGDAETPPSPPEPLRIDEIDQPHVFKVDTATDFPFDHTFLVENLLDPAHVYISHDRTEFGIRRADAKPLDMDILNTTVAGLQGQFRRAGRPAAPWVTLTFHAPILVHYSFSNPTVGVIGGLALYALPLSYGHSRILVRRYGTFFPRVFRWQPRWLEHLRQNKILEEDLAFIVAQDRHFRHPDRTIQADYLPLKSCDQFVMAHRRWLDQFGQDLPWAVGYATNRLPLASPAQNTESNQPSRSLTTRFERHTRHCQACNQANQTAKQGQRLAQISGGVLLGLAVLTEGWVQLSCLLGAGLSAGTIAIAAEIRLRLNRGIGSERSSYHSSPD